MGLSLAARYTHVCRVCDHSLIDCCFLGDQSIHFTLILSRSALFDTPAFFLRMAAIASEYLATVLKPEQFAAAIFGVTLAFTTLSLNTVGLRAWSRLRSNQFGRDDYLMCTALAVNLVHNSVVMHGTFVGIGSPDSKLTPDREAEGKKVPRFPCPSPERSPAKLQPS